MKIFFTQNQSAEDFFDSFSPSARKPGLFVKYLQQKGRNIEIVDPQPISREDFYLAHTKNYVDGVFAGTELNGFGNRSLKVAKTLPYTSGSMLAAANAALNGERITCSPTSGFHHAGYRDGGGFCTFNGLMITALKLKKENKINKIAIIDCDNHYGDGTEDIVSVTKSKNWCFTTENSLTRYRGKNYLLALEDLLHRASRFNPDLILYQAGGDVHIDDPLGGTLTTAEMAQRDKIVFNFTNRNKIPVAWNLAGGYQVSPDGSINKVLDLHLQTFDIAKEIYK
jgi:acetoin utilization deacetylase AcuC-like enzyme